MDTSEHKIAEAIKLPRINQVGIVVEDIDASVEMYSQLLNIKPWYRSQTDEHEIYYRGKKIDLELDLVFAFNGKVQIELIKVISGEKNIYSDILEEHGGGLHHLGTIAGNIDRKIDDFQKNGIEVIQRGTVKSKGGAITRYAYFDTVATCGIITEVIETKLMGLTIGQSKFLMNLGCLTGDTEKLKLS